MADWEGSDCRVCIKVYVRTGEGDGGSINVGHDKADGGTAFGAEY